MSESEIPDEMLVGMLRERGYEVTKRDEPNLSDKIDAVAGKLAEIREHAAPPEEEQEQPRPPRDPEQRFAEGLRDELNRAQSPWFNLSEVGGDDGPQAA
jgi:hypothetical protein